MTTNDFPPQLVLQQLIQGFQVTQCIYVAAKLGIADLLKDGPRTSEDLAQVTGTHAPSLYRVLRLLTAVDLLTEGETHSFALTPLGAYLQTGVPGSMHDTVLLYGDKPFWQAWGTCCTGSKQASRPFIMSSGSHFLTIISCTPSMQHSLTI
jgi:hypothetical protein